MKKIVILLLIQFLVLQVKSQNNTFKANLEVTYRLEYSLDSTNIEKKSSEDFYLFLGDDKSKFISVNKWIGDSITAKMAENFNGSINFANTNVPKTKFSEVIYKNFEKNRLQFIGRVGTDMFLYDEAIKPYSWDIKQEIKIINEFKVQKAVTKFGGREYVAWFTDKIPIPQGPYKFEGLPGLIVQISDTENHYEYQLISLKEHKEKKEIDLIDTSKNFIRVSKEEFFQAKYDYYADYFARLSQKGISVNLSPKQKKKIQEKFDSRNNPIELE
jgi:GLPGLI family protein